jgi:hypothetical protein
VTYMSVGQYARTDLLDNSVRHERDRPLHRDGEPECRLPHGFR